MSITTIIIGLTVIASVLALFKKEYFYRFEYNPYLVHHSKQWHRFFTHAFIHADWIHLFVNMYVLYMFGRYVERFYDAYLLDRGTLYYIMLYVGGILFSALPALKKHKNNANYNAVGASGAVSAVLFSSIVFNPIMNIYFFFIPIGIPAFVFGILYLVFEAYMDKKGGDNVAHDAHLWGAIFGFVFTIILQPSLGLSFIQKVLSIFG